MSDQRYEFLIGMHEVIEAYLAIYAGVSPDAVDRFDKAYEAKRKPGDDSEPGDDPRAPYHREHVFDEQGRAAPRARAWRQLVSVRPRGVEQVIVGRISGRAACPALDLPATGRAMPETGKRLLRRRMRLFEIIDLADMLRRMGEREADALAMPAGRKPAALDNRDRPRNRHLHDYA